MGYQSFWPAVIISLLLLQDVASLQCSCWVSGNAPQVIQNMARSGSLTGAAATNANAMCNNGVCSPDNTLGCFRIVNRQMGYSAGFCGYWALGMGAGAVSGLNIITSQLQDATFPTATRCEMASWYATGACFCDNGDRCNSASGLSPAKFGLMILPGLILTILLNSF